MGMSEYIRKIRNKIGHTLLQMPSVTIASFDDTGRILLVKHGDTDLWVLPGGAIEPEETPADAAVREMWEETGLTVDLLGILGVYGGPEFVVEYSNGDRTSYVMTVFEGRVTGGRLNPVDDEITEATYFPAYQVAGLSVQAWVRTVLPVVFKRGESSLFRPAIWKPADA